MKKNHLFIISIIWILILIASFSWNLHLINENSIKIVENRAQSFFSQIIVARAWNSSHNGVYVPVSENLQPNPYLEDSVRDIITIKGRALTKINPAYMTRQIAEINHDRNDLQFHITSLKPIRPANKADEWEEKALKLFENEGLEELLEENEINGTDVYRYMAPLITEKSCLKCHAKQGYAEGDIRGGISITFDSQIYATAKNKQTKALSIVHMFLMLSGLFGLALYHKKSNEYYQEINLKNQDLEESQIQVKKSNLELTETIAKKEKLFSIIAHDLKSPLASIMGLSEIIIPEKEEIFNQKKINILSSIHNTSKLTLELLDNLLDWSLSETKNIEFILEEIAISELVENTIELTNSSALKKNIKIINKISSETLITADKKMMSAIIRNLLSNAIKYSDSGGTIHVRSKDMASEIIICIEDSGVGIPEENMDEIFSSTGNISTLGTNNEKGTGLGLLLCKEFIEKHEGKIWVKSEFDEGSTFYFSIPKPN